MSKDIIYREDAIQVVSHVAMECIDRKTRIELINAIPSADRPSDPHDITYINALKNRIKELEADRPQGEWIYTNNPLRLDDEWACSRCGNISFLRTNFCDRCGARMKGAGDETD